MPPAFGTIMSELLFLLFIGFAVYMARKKPPSSSLGAAVGK